MRGKNKASLYVLAAFLAVILFCFVWTRYTHLARKIPVDSLSHIIAITIMTKESDVAEDQSLSGKDIPKGLEADLLQCIGQYSMTGTPISVQEPKIISDCYIFISVWIRNTDESSFRINISNTEGHSSVQFDEQYFGIIDSEQMLDDIKSILRDEPRQEDKGTVLLSARYSQSYQDKRTVPMSY